MVMLFLRPVCVCVSVAYSFAENTTPLTLFMERPRRLLTLLEFLFPGREPTRPHRHNSAVSRKTLKQQSIHLRD